MSELYELPDGWEWIEFKKVFDNPSSKPYQISKAEYMEIGKFPIIDQGKKFIIGYTDNKEKLYDNESNCIIFGDHTREIKYINFNFVIGADGTKIFKEKDITKYDLKYLYFQLLSKNIESLGYSRHFKLIKKMSFSIPSLQEQKRIVSKLDSLFEKIDKVIALHQKNIDEANVFMGSVLNDVFVELEEKYNLKTIESFSKVGTGVTPLKSKTQYYKDGTKNWITSKATNSDFVYGCEQLVTKIAIDECKLKIYPIGSIIVALYGQGKTRGQVSELMIETATNQAVATIVVDDNQVINRYLKYFLKKSYIDLRKKASGGIQPNLNLTIIKKILLPIPSLKTQQKTVTYLDFISKELETLKQTQKEKMESLVALKASILDQAFRGKL